MGHAQVIGIIGIKGGVGKTTATCNLAAALANQFNKKVLVVDANFSAPNLGIHLGVLEPEVTIHHVLTNKKEITEAIYDSGHGFHIIPGQLRGSGKLNVLSLKESLKELKDAYDYILIDSSPNLNQEIASTMVAADKLFVMTTPDYPTLSCTIHAVKVARRKKVPIAGLILNRVYNRKSELSVEAIEEAAETPVLAVLPHDVVMVDALGQTMPAHSLGPRKDVSVEYNHLAAAIVGESYEDPRLKTKFKRFFGQKPGKPEENRELFRAHQI